jgi:multidrug efflux system membrane fusion protein
MLMDEMQSPPGEYQSIHHKLFKKLPPSQYAWLYSIVILLLITIIWFALSTHKRKPIMPKPVAVSSAPAISADVPIYLSALGSVTPTYSVTVKTQINGQLLQVLFKEGQTVKTGQLLAQIDSRPYEALLAQYEGNLKRDTALLANANIDLKRYETLWKQNSIAQQVYAAQQSLVAQYEGAIKSDEGLIQGVKVNLLYTRISSPIDGRIGLRLVDAGNFVQTTDTTGIAVINTVQPITVLFALAEDHVPQLIPQFYAHKDLAVQAYDRQLNQLLAQGTLLSVDNQIDVTTGTFKLKGLFDNKDNTLFPNQFVNTKILVNTLNNATLVPTAAIQHALKNDFVFAVDNTTANKISKVKVIPVVTGAVSGENTVIQKGISPGQWVVVAGSDKLKEGMQVLLNETKAPATS